VSYERQFRRHIVKLTVPWASAYCKDYLAFSLASPVFGWECRNILEHTHILQDHTILEHTQATGPF